MFVKRPPWPRHEFYMFVKRPPWPRHEFYMFVKWPPWPRHEFLCLSNGKACDLRDGYYFNFSSTASSRRTSNIPLTCFSSALRQGCLLPLRHETIIKLSCKPLYIFEMRTLFYDALTQCNKTRAKEEQEEEKEEEEEEAEEGNYISVSRIIACA